MQQRDSLSKPEFGERGNSLTNRISSKAAGRSAPEHEGTKINITDSWEAEGPLPGHPMVPAPHGHYVLKTGVLRWITSSRLIQEMLCHRIMDYRMV